MPLRGAVERASGRPRLWLCGHIHESSGAELTRFRSRRGGRDAGTVCSTLVANAANANPGLAKRLVSGPMRIELRGPAPDGTDGAA